MIGSIMKIINGSFACIFLILSVYIDGFTNEPTERAIFVLMWAIVLLINFYHIEAD